MRSEDDAERLLRVIRERKQEMIERVVSGVQPDGPGGYWNLIGGVAQLEWAETAVIQELRGHFPDEIKSSAGRHYGV